MKKLINTLFIALILAVSVTFIRADGQIPTGGRPANPENQTTKAAQPATQASVWFWTLINIPKFFFGI